MLRKDWDDLAAGQKGDWYFFRKDTYITIRWGDNRFDVVTIPISTNGERVDRQITWTWDGNKESPTISPSIRILGAKDAPDVWHGFLRAGKLETV